MLALREHSRAELERKLIVRLRPAATATPADHHASFDEDRYAAGLADLKAELARVLDELESHGLLNDERAAGALVLAKSPRYGSRRLKQMLQARSFDADLVSSSLQQAAGSELERARDVWQRRFGQAPCDLRERARQHRFLSARGFDAGVVERVMKEALTHPSAVIEQDDDA